MSVFSLNYGFPHPNLALRLIFGDSNFCGSDSDDCLACLCRTGWRREFGAGRPSLTCKPVCAPRKLKPIPSTRFKLRLGSSCASTFPRLRGRCSVWRGKGLASRHAPNTRQLFRPIPAGRAGASEYACGAEAAGDQSARARCARGRAHAVVRGPGLYPGHAAAGRHCGGNPMNSLRVNLTGPNRHPDDRNLRSPAVRGGMRRKQWVVLHAGPAAPISLQRASDYGECRTSRILCQRRIYQRDGMRTRHLRLSNDGRGAGRYRVVGAQTAFLRADDWAAATEDSGR